MVFLGVIYLHGSVDLRVTISSMKQSRLPTLEEMKSLTAFLPILYTEGFSPIERWDGGEKLDDHTITLPYPKYNPLVDDFFRQAGSDPWLDYRYDPEEAYQMLCDRNGVKTATLEQIKAMLTFCVRGERFSDGHWGEMIERGFIRRLLERLNEIIAEQN